MFFPPDRQGRQKDTKFYEQSKKMYRNKSRSNPKSDPTLSGGNALREPKQALLQGTIGRDGQRFRPLPALLKLIQIIGRLTTVCIIV